MDNSQEKQLMADYLNGDPKALDRLIVLYLKPIYRFVYRLTGSQEESNDITQEIFVKLWKNTGKYNPEQNFKTWLFKIARNTTIDWLRKRKDLTFSQLTGDDLGESFEDTIPDLQPLPDKIFEQKELSESLTQAIDQLSFNYKNVLLLHLDDQLTFEEIAQVIDKPMNTVKSQYRRALLTLRQYLDSAPK